LWLLVLLKLVTPPLVPIPVLPAIAAKTSTKTQELSEPTIEMKSIDTIGGNELADNPVYADNHNEIEQVAPNKSSLPMGSVSSSPRVEPSSGRSRFTWRNAVIGLLATSLCVSMIIWFAAWRQLRRLRRLLCGKAVESGRAVDLLELVTRQFDVKGLPGLLIVEAVVAPMLWVRCRKSTIVLPR